MEILFVLGGGIGNIIQGLPAIVATASEGHNVDLKLVCNSTNDLDICRIPEIRNLYVNENPVGKYDWQLNGPFTPGTKYKAKQFAKPKIHYAQHVEEAKVYYNLAKQIGIKTPMKCAKISIPNNNKIPEQDTVAIYPGSKPDWAMKRWDKYDELSKKFESVIVVGTENDIYSHGKPTWIKKKWDWPSNVEFFMGSLQETACLISNCQMFIGNDGGLAHVAAATGVPTFVLFGPSSTVKNKPYTKNSHVIAIDLECRPCQFQKGNDGLQIFDSGKANCPFNMRCMRNMSVDFVYNEISRLMQSNT